MKFFTKKKNNKESVVQSKVMTSIENRPAGIKNSKNKDNQDFPLAIAQLRTANNRLFFILIITLLAFIIMTMFAWNRSSKVDKNQQLLYVQMWENGKYNVLEELPEDAVIVTKNIINSLLEKYIKLRHGQIPQSIVVDYDDASTFLSDNLYDHFINKNEFNASGRLKKIKEDLIKGNAETIEIEFRSQPEHYDAIDGTDLQGSETVIMRTNMYVTKVTRNAQGNIINTEYNIHRLQWHLMNKEKLAKETKDWIRANPIGIVIIADDVVVDKVATDKSKIKNNDN